MIAVILFRSMLHRRPLSWLLFFVLLSLTVLIYPIYVIRPFRHQGARELGAALAVMRFRPTLEVLFVAASIALFVLIWRQGHKLWRRTVAAVSTVLVIGFAVLSRVNVYELMFHPLDRPTFSSALKAKLGAGEEVIAIRVGGEARAYPIRSMSYHHIVNDTVGGVPIVSTY